MNKASKLQKEYYKKTHKEYDKMHLGGVNTPHFVALEYFSSFIKHFDLKSILDVGTGTGRVVKYLTEIYDNLKINGMDVSEELLEEGIKKGIDKSLLYKGNGENIPFPNNSYGCVCSFGVLHHVEHPDLVVKEMIRVAKKMVFISDNNRFGQGHFIFRLIKLFLFKIRLWWLVDFIKTKGKGYHFSKGDGVYYSYSIYDSLSLLYKWSDQLFLIPTDLRRGKKKKKFFWLHPLLTSGSILVCAVKN